MKAINFFKALADETRLRLIHLSLHYELNVNEIVTIMKMGQSRISRHLKILTDCRCLTFRRDKLWTYYSAANSGEGRQFIDSIKYLFAADPVFTRDLEDAQLLREEQRKQTTRFFDNIAEDWEMLKKEILGGVDLNSLILEASLPCRTIVDLGCGTGDLLLSLKQKAQVVIGVEKSQNMLEAARKRFADDNANISLRIGEIEHLPLREGEADLAVINMVLHHLPAPVDAFTEIHRILKKDDHLIIVDFLQHDRQSMQERYGDLRLGFSEEDITDWLHQVGFKIEMFNRFPLKKGLKGFLARAVKCK